MSSVTATAAYGKLDGSCNGKVNGNCYGKGHGKGYGKLDGNNKSIIINLRRWDMAVWQQVFGVLAAATGPMSRVQLEDKLGVKFGAIATQMERWMGRGKGAAKPPLIEDTGDYHYVLTEEGRKKAMEEAVLQDITGVSGAPETADQAVATTEYKQFERLGALSGCVPAALIKQTADYVFEGGDYKDMKWVAQAMQELGIQTDVRSRWWHCWRGKMRQAIPSDLPAEFLSGEGKTGEKKETKGKRDYIMSEDDNPTYAGEGLGDLDHDEAFELAKIRAGAAVRRRDVSQSAGAASQIEEVGKAFQTFKEMMGEKAAGKSYVIKPGENGYQVEEVDTSKPVLIPQTGGAKPGTSYYVDSDGTVKELLPGQPVVIIKEPPKAAAPSSTHYLIDQRTGEVKEVAPGQPVVIIRESTPVSQLTPIQVTDKDGKPMVLDLATFIKLEEHRDKQHREEESHETKMEIAKGFKDLLNKAGKALSHMAEEEKE